MRILIDGYNLMFAQGLLGSGRRTGAERFRRTRRRFLNDLADALGPVEAARTTVVFDAAEPPDHLPDTSTHHGLTVRFATDDGEADSLLERLIAADPTPKSLTVVSSDLRIRRAAQRKKAQAITSDAFLDRLDRLRRDRRTHVEPAARGETTRPEPAPSDVEAWLQEFAALGDDRHFQELAAHRDDFLPTDDDLARIAREVDREPLADGRPVRHPAPVPRR